MGTYFVKPSHTREELYKVCGTVFGEADEEVELKLKAFDLLLQGFVKKGGKTQSRSLLSGWLVTNVKSDFELPGSTTRSYLKAPEALTSCLLTRMQTSFRNIDQFLSRLSLRG